MVCLGNEQRSFCRFWDCIQRLHFRLLLTMMATPFILRDSCPQKWILWSFELNSPIPVHFSLLIPRMLAFTLAIALIPGPNIPGSYAILLFTASDLASITSHIQNWVLVLLWLHPFILSGVISPLISSSIWAPTDLGSSSFSILSFCLLILFMGFSRQEYWSGLPFPSPVDHILSDLQWTTFCQTSPPWPVRLGWPRMAWLSFIELHTIVVLWSDWLVFCDYGFSVPALWCPLATPTVLLGFLLPWTGGMSLQLFQQSAAAAPYLGHGVSPLCHYRWPWAWGSSSWLPPLTWAVG